MCKVDLSKQSEPNPLVRQLEEVLLGAQISSPELGEGRDRLMPLDLLDFLQVLAGVSGFAVAVAHEVIGRVQGEEPSVVKSQELKPKCVVPAIHDPRTRVAV